MIDIFCLLSATLVHGGLQITLLLWGPNKEDIIIFYVIAGLWGVGDAVIQTQINGMYLWMKAIRAKLMERLVYKNINLKQWTFTLRNLFGHICGHSRFCTVTLFSALRFVPNLIIIYVRFKIMFLFPSDGVSDFKRNNSFTKGQGQ